MKKVTPLLLLLIFTLSLALPACAAQSGPGGGPSMSQGNSQSGNAPGMNQGTGQPGGGPGMGGNSFTNQLSSLVTAGTITQAQADAVAAALKPSESEKPGSTTTASTTDPSSLMKTKLDALVTAGTITSDQETAILAAIKPPTDGQGGTMGNGPGGNSMQSALDKLVTAGTITQDLETTILAAITPAEGETPGSGSTIETKLAAMVTAGTITSAQEEAILAAIKPANQGQGKTGNQAGQNSSGQSKGNPVKSALTSLVTAGTITQDIADTILDALKPSNSDTTPAAINKTGVSEALAAELSSLVTAGTITQAQSDAISTAVSTATQNNGHMRLQIGSSTMTVGSSPEQIDPGYNTAPTIQNGTTFVPIRAIIEKLGGTVTWDSDTQTLTATLGDNTVSVTVGSDTATVNGKSVTLTKDPYISSTGRTMLPLRFIAESLGLQVDWDQNSQSIDIQK